MVGALLRVAALGARPARVEHRPHGRAGGNLGAEHVARSAPDGHSLLLATVGVLAINPALYARLPYDAAADLAPVALVAAAPVALEPVVEGLSEFWNTGSWLSASASRTSPVSVSAT